MSDISDPHVSSTTPSPLPEQKNEDEGSEPKKTEDQENGQNFPVAEVEDETHDK